MSVSAFLTSQKYTNWFRNEGRGGQNGFLVFFFVLVQEAVLALSFGNGMNSEGNNSRSKAGTGEGTAPNSVWGGGGCSYCVWGGPFPPTLRGDPPRPAPDFHRYPPPAASRASSLPPQLCLLAGRRGRGRGGGATLGPDPHCVWVQCVRPPPAPEKAAVCICHPALTLGIWPSNSVSVVRVIDRAIPPIRLETAVEQPACCIFLKRNYISTIFLF